MTFAAAGTAKAKGIPKIWTFGDDFYDLGEAKAGDAAAISMSGVKVGYHCQAFGLFWVNIFTWSGEYCLYKGSGLETKTYEPVSQEEAAKYLGVSKVSKPWNYSFPPGMFVVLGLIGLKVGPRLLAKKQAAASAKSWQGGSPSAPSGQTTPSWSPGMQSSPPPMPGAGTPPPVPPPMPPEQQ